MNTDGHIPEKEYECIGFMTDTTYANKEVDKPNGILQEIRHRAKIISHWLQRNLPRKKEDDTAAVMKQKEDHELIIRNVLHRTNDEWITKLQTISFANLIIETFIKLLKAKLRMFVHICLFYTGIIPSGQSSLISTKKWKFEDTISRETKNIIREAHESREKDIKLPRPEIDSYWCVYLIN